MLNVIIILVFNRILLKYQQIYMFVYRIYFFLFSGLQIRVAILEVW